MICHLQKPCGWWNAAAFHQPLLSLSPTKNVNYTPLSFHLCSRQAIQGPPRHIGTKVNCRTMSRLEGPLRFISSLSRPPHVLSRRGANHAIAPKSAAAEPVCRQYRVVRWFLLPEAGLRRRCFPPTTFVILTNRKCQLYHCLPVWAGRH